MADGWDCSKISNVLPALLLCLLRGASSHTRRPRRPPSDVLPGHASPICLLLLLKLLLLLPHRRLAFGALQLQPAAGRRHRRLLPLHRVEPPTVAALLRFQSLGSCGQEAGGADGERGGSS